MMKMEDRTETMSQNDENWKNLFTGIYEYMNMYDIYVESLSKGGDNS